MRVTLIVDDLGLAWALANTNARIAARNQDAADAHRTEVRRLEADLAAQVAGLPEEERDVVPGIVLPPAPLPIPALTAEAFLQDYIDAVGGTWNAKAAGEEALVLRQRFEAKPLPDRRALLGPER